MNKREPGQKLESSGRSAGPAESNDLKGILGSILIFPSVTRRKIGLLLAIILLATCFEGFGVAMLFPIMDFIEKGRDFAMLARSSRMWSFLGQALDLLGLPKSLISLMAIVFGLLVVRQIFNYTRSLYSAWITEGIYADIRGGGFRLFSAADLPFYDSYGVGKLINVLTVDGVRAGGGVFNFINLVAAATVFAAYFVFLFLLAPGMTLFAMVIMGAVGFLLRSKITRSREVGVEISRYNEQISSSLVERLNGIRLLKMAATERVETKRIAELSDAIKRKTYEIAKIRARMEFVVDPIVILAGLIILYCSVEVFHMSLAETGIFLFVLLRMMPYIKDIFNSRQGLAGFTGSLSRVREMLEKAREADCIRGGDVSTMALKKGVQFEQVSFQYRCEDGLVLQDVNMFIPAGKLTALVGRSGAGKSTLIDLLPRLRVPVKGRITFDDIPIEDFRLDVLRRSIAFVSQEGFLFDDTIENNIRYCSPGASSAELAAASTMAYAHEFITTFPKGYGTVVGERGVKLSGGQRQRIVLARALLQKAPIIILDEPTSSLDSESERFIQTAMERIRAEARVTMIIIAHRLSTIRSADQIVVIEKGRIAESGSHRDLMHEDTWYADMVRMQTVG